MQEQPKLKPQQSLILEQLRKVPGSNIGRLHVDLNMPYESVRTSVTVLLKLKLIEKRGDRPLYVSGLFEVEQPKKQAS